MKIDCPSFKLHIDGKYFNSYPTRADLYNAILALGLSGREIWKVSGCESNVAWCKRNEIDPSKFYDECYMSAE